MLRQRIVDRSARIGVIGLGYVGLPLAVAFADEFRVIGFEIDRRKVEKIAAGESYITDVPSSRLSAHVEDGAFEATADYSGLSQCDAIVICVPTSLDRSGNPNLSYLQNAAQVVAGCLRPGQIVVLESTSYPGTTEELLPLLSRGGLKLDRDFFLAFSPERIDPGNQRFKLADIPKVVGGCSHRSSQAACALYGSIVKRVYRASSARVAETAKLLENTFRMVNIGLANEMALLCHRLGVDSREVLEVAATKPFGYMPFFPGPGVGGPCIPSDALSLAWSAKQQGFISRFIALADDANSAMPGHVVNLAAQAMNQRRKAVRGSRVLLLGVAYKANIDDTRHAPAVAIMHQLRALGATVVYHDPFVQRLELDFRGWPERPPGIQPQNEPHPRLRLAGVEADAPGERCSDPLTSVALTDEEITTADCVIIVTDHAVVDYERVASLADIIVDTRNALNEAQRRSAPGIIVRI
ncbi:MAG: nucleotide sugar dehydrogenase [Candidatus Tumulicola sp.]